MPYAFHEIESINHLITKIAQIVHSQLKRKLKSEAIKSIFRELKREQKRDLPWRWRPEEGRNVGTSIVWFGAVQSYQL